MGVRLLEGLQQDALVLVAEAANIHHESDAARPDRGLEVEERLQRQLVKLGRLVRQEADLVDRERFDPVVFPVVGVPGQRRLGQERRGERASRGRLPQTRFADEKICVREAV